MNVIWKRPDGYHGAVPADYRVVNISGESNIWLHKTDSQWFPFRVSGGWQDEDATNRLNGLINLLGQDNSATLEHLSSLFGHSNEANAESYYQETLEWLGQLKDYLKGDTWEVEIMEATLDATIDVVTSCHKPFIENTADQAPV